MNFHTSSLSNLTPFAAEFRESSSVVRGVAFVKDMPHPNCRHGESGKRTTKEYSTWFSMKARCMNMSNQFYHRYGGRGITVCDRWMTFDNFLADMGRAPSPKHSIDRINNNGNYEPSNCRWATSKEQQRNRGNKRLVCHNGEVKLLVELSDAYGIGPDTLQGRIDRGWPIDRALSTPPLKRHQWVANATGVNKTKK